MANTFEFLSKDGNITPEKARKSRQMQFHDKTAYVWMGILPLKKRVNRDKCSFATKQRMLGVFVLRNPVPRFPHFMPPCPVKCQHIQTWNMDATQTKFYHKYRQTANDMAYLSK